MEQFSHASHIAAKGEVIIKSAGRGQGAARGKQRLLPSLNGGTDGRQPPHPVFRKVSNDPFMTQV